MEEEKAHALYQQLREAGAGAAFRKVRVSAPRCNFVSVP
jgi:hypothetical protein